MMGFKRRGHYRTNANGTRFWVSPHDVEKEFYTLNRHGAGIYIDQKKLLPTACRHCYRKVFYIALRSSENVYFNNSEEPLSRHNCIQTNQTAKNDVSKKAPKPYLSAEEAEFLTSQRRAELVRETLNLRSSISPDEMARLRTRQPLVKLQSITQSKQGRRKKEKNARKQLKREQAEELIWKIQNVNSALEEKLKSNGGKKLKSLEIRLELVRNINAILQNKKKIMNMMKKKDRPPLEVENIEKNILESSILEKQLAREIQRIIAKK